MGNHIAERFAKENFQVMLVARRQSALDEYATELYAAFMQGGRACEISAKEAVERFKVLPKLIGSSTPRKILSSTFLIEVSK